MLPMYLITQEQANTIGEFEYNIRKFFNPFVRLQVGDMWIVSDEMYNELIGNSQFNSIDWTNVTTTSTFNDKNSGTSNLPF